MNPWTQSVTGALRRTDAVCGRRRLKFARSALARGGRRATVACITSSLLLMMRTVEPALASYSSPCPRAKAVRGQRWMMVLYSTRRWRRCGRPSRAVHSPSEVQMGQERLVPTGPPAASLWIAGAKRRFSRKVSARRGCAERTPPDCQQQTRAAYTGQT